MALPVSDEGAFGALVRLQLSRLHQIAFAILGNDDDARDALQEALTSAWHGLSGLRDPARADAWLMRILVNQCRSALRHRRRQPVREIYVESPGEEGSQADAAGTDIADVVSRRDVLERTFDRLDADARAIVVLRYVDDRTVPDIAELLGIPQGTVKSRLHAARRTLARSLERELR